jgi:hypothetical protein
MGGFEEGRGVDRVRLHRRGVAENLRDALEQPTSSLIAAWRVNARIRPNVQFDRRAGTNPRSRVFFVSPIFELATGKTPRRIRGLKIERGLPRPRRNVYRPPASGRERAAPTSQGA